MLGPNICVLTSLVYYTQAGCDIVCWATCARAWPCLHNAHQRIWCKICKISTSNRWYNLVKKGSQSKRQLGVIAIAGPIYGFLATIGIGLWGIHINDLLYVAGAIVFGLVNASNLLPLYQLDGGSVLSCITSSINKWVGLIVMGSIQLAVIVVSCKYSFYILAFVAGLGLGQVVRQFRFNKNKGDLNPRGVKSLTVIYLATIVAHVLLMYYLLGVDGSRDAVTAILGERLKNI